jgi:hypothetical protein
MAKSKTLNAVPCGIDRNWQVEDDLRTIRRAEEIKTDKGRLSAVKKLAVKEQKALQSIAGRTQAKKGGSR